MPKNRYPKDRFDDVPSAGRVGAHRAENPRMRAGAVLLWSAVATIILIVLGIFGSLLLSGRIELFPAGAEPVPTATTPAVEPVVDTAYQVLILNATDAAGLATQTKDAVVAAGWAADDVLASEAGSTDFPETTVYYVAPEDEAAAAGLADVIGGARTEQSDAYPSADPERSQLTIVLGVDRTGGGEPAPDAP